MNPYKLPIITGNTQKSIRFPDDLISDIEHIIAGTGWDFSKFVVAATREKVERLKKEAVQD